jgi:aminocarboxymuconate-semialdehyde decarboxylase
METAGTMQPATAESFIATVASTLRSSVTRENPWNKVPVDHILSIPGLSDEDRIAILGGTAAKLLGIAA